MPDAAVRSPHLTREKLLLDVSEVGYALGCGRSLVFRLIAAGELRTVKVGRLTRIPLGEVEEFVGRRLGGSTPGRAG
jgi:excisionase family DNA binding protein